MHDSSAACDPPLSPSTNQVPMFSIAVPFDEATAQRRGYPGAESTGHTLTEALVVDALANVTWMRCAATRLGV